MGGNMRQKIFVVACALVVLLVSMNTVGCEQTPTELDATNRDQITAILSREITPYQLSSFLQSYKEHDIMLLSYKLETNRIHILYTMRDEYVNGQWIDDLGAILFMDARVLWVRAHRHIGLGIDDVLRLYLYDDVDAFEFLNSYSDYRPEILFFVPGEYFHITWDSEIIDEPDFFAILYYDPRVRFIHPSYALQ